MERHDEKYFTIWYGVFDRAGRRLTYASGGHPPALLLTGPTPETSRPVELGLRNFLIGMMAGVTFAGESVPVDPSGKPYVFSDGAYEVHRPGGPMMTHGELVDYLTS